MPMVWFMLNPNVTPDDLGFIPTFLSDTDTRSARVQLDSNYQHGGGWHKFDGFEFNPETKAITYPGDAPLFPNAMTVLRAETIYVYPCSWVLVVQDNGAYEVARMD